MPHGRDTTCAAFVPGFMQHAEAWAPVAAQVQRQTPTALVELATPTLDGCLAAIRDAGRGGVLVGYSMGGRLALHAAVREPQAYRALVLVGATPGIEDEAMRRSRRAADDELAGWIANRPIQAIVRYWETQPIFATQTPELVRRQRRGRLEHDPEQLALLLRATGQGRLRPLWGDLQKLGIPVLAVAGELDEKYAQIAERMADEMPLGRAALIPGAGHAAHLEEPEGFTELLLDFLDQNLR